MTWSCERNLDSCLVAWCRGACSYLVLDFSNFLEATSKMLIDLLR